VFPRHVHRDNNSQANNPDDQKGDFIHVPRMLTANGHT
jgi:hypothetical protein